MAAAYDRSRSAMARSKNARETNIQPPPSPRSPNRRHTLPAGKTQSAPTPASMYRRPSARIEKTPQAGRSLRQEPTWADQFDDDLAKHKDTIRDEVDKSLNEVHVQHIAKVKELSEQVKDRLSILQESEEPLHLSLANEVLQIAVNHPDAPAGQEQNVQVEMQVRIKAFQEFANKKHTVIRTLIKDWNEAQVRVIALAAEIIGPGNITFSKKEKYKDYPDLNKVLCQSKISYDKAEDDFKEVLAEISDFEQQMGQLTAETKVSMHQIQQAKSSKQRNAIKQMQKLLKDLHEGD